MSSRAYPAKPPQAAYFEAFTPCESLLILQFRRLRLQFLAHLKPVEDPASISWGTPRKQHHRQYRFTAAMRYRQRH